MPVQPDDDDAPIRLIRGAPRRPARSSGTGSYRVKASMARVARALGIDRQHAQVTLTEITTTSHRGHSFRTEVTEVRTVGVNTDRLAEPGVARAGLRAARDRPDRGGRGLDRPDRGEAAPVPDLAERGLGRAGVLGVRVPQRGGSGRDRRCCGRGDHRPGAAPVSLHRGYNQFGVTMAGRGQLGPRLPGLRQRHVPDGPHGRSARRRLRRRRPVPRPRVPAGHGGPRPGEALDFSAGVARLTWAVMILVSAAFGVWAVSIVGLRPDAPHWFLPVGLEWTLRLVASFVGVLGFALMFNGSPRLALTAVATAKAPSIPGRARSRRPPRRRRWRPRSPRSRWACSPRGSPHG